MLSIGWVDFSKSDRDIALSVLRLLSEQGAVDELIIRREQELKGKSRAKLTQLGRWDEMQNNVNMRQLNFRLDIAKTIVRDIFEGVGHHA